MQTSYTVPDNLPVVPLDRAQKDLGLGHEAGRRPFRWGAFKLTDEQMDGFERLLEKHLGSPLPWSREEIELMHYDLLRLVALLVEDELDRRFRSDDKKAES